MIEFLFDPGNSIVWILIVSIIVGAVAVISRPFASFVQFAYPNAKYEAIGNPYIKKNRCENLAESDSLNHFIDQLNIQKDYQIEGTSASEVQQHLDDHLIEMIDQMKQDHGKKMKAFFTSYVNFTHAWIIKEIIRSIHQDTEIDTDSLINRSVSTKITTFINAISDATEEEVDSVLKTFGLDDAFIEMIRDSETMPIQLDAQVDRYFIQQMEKITVPYKCQPAKHEYLSRLVDILTIKHLLRAKQMKYHEKLCEIFFIGEGYEIPRWKFNELCNAETVKDIVDLVEGTSYHPFLKRALDHHDISSSVQPLITSLDEAMLDIMKQISQRYYVSIGPSIRFMVSKEMEIINLKIICKGIAEQVNKDLIASLLITEEES